MKKTLIFALVLLPNSGFSQSSALACWSKVYLQAGTFNCGQQTTVFEDNFTGTSLDTNKWQTVMFGEDHPYARTGGVKCEDTLYFDNNISVSNGTCKLTGRREPGSSWTNHENETFYRDFTSGLIMTRSDLDGYYFGRYEARFKPPGRGWWPAFWMWHHDEIDIFENFADDTKFLNNVYSGTDECGNVSYEHSADLLNGNWHTFAVEWTPFKLTFYHNGTTLFPEIYRLYDEYGDPLDIDCNHSVIPGGTYYLNPVFPEIRHRVFRPIIGHGVLPKHGQNCDCTDYSCSSVACNDWGGHPIDENCVKVGDYPTTMEIDYVRVVETDFAVCESILVYGNNCSQTGNLRSPLNCNNNTYPNTDAKIYVENYSAHSWSNEVNITDVQSSQNIDVLVYDNYEITYEFTQPGDGQITIFYEDDCQNQTSFIVNLSTKTTNHNFSNNIITRVYPNPFLDHIKIDLSKQTEEKVEIKIFLLTGQLFFEEIKYNPGPIIFISPELNAGMYILELKFDSHSERHKVLKL